MTSDDGQPGGDPSGTWRVPPPPDAPPGAPSWGAPQPAPPGGGFGPAPERGPVPLRPLDLGDVLDGTFRLLRADWRSLLFLTAVFYLPLSLLTTWVQREILSGPGLVDSVVGTGLAFQAVDLDRVLLGSALLSLLSFVVVEPIVEGAVARIAASRYLGGSTAWREAAGVALRRAGVLIAARLLVALAVLAAFAPMIALVVGAVVAGSVLLGVLASVFFLLGLVAGLLLWALFVGSVPAIVVEQAGPVTALRRSARLLRPRIWPVLGTMLLAYLVATLVSGVAGFPFSFAGQLVGGQVALVLVAIGGVLSGMLARPLIVLPATLLYFDGRVRREGLDLELGADAQHRSW